MWREVYTKGTRFGTNADWRREHLKKEHAKSVTDAELKAEEEKMLEEMCRCFLDQNKLLVQRARERTRYNETQRRVIREALTGRKRKEEISRMIVESMDPMKEGIRERKKTAETRGRIRKKTLRSKEQGRQVTEKGDGQIWMVSEEKAKVLVRRWEQRRRQMLARWESLPPGPPGPGESLIGGEDYRSRRSGRRNTLAKQIQ